MQAEIEWDDDRREWVADLGDGTKLVSASKSDLEADLDMLIEGVFHVWAGLK